MKKCHGYYLVIGGSAWESNPSRYLSYMLISIHYQGHIGQG